ncbi:MAG: LPXTG cell wall anchor domain-containing protein [Oscillospiraceae bacterium]|jgi:LPXTG-motif cell wall-anchored protein|nr:LPXTG cell wall anchor domain-containing protein [Oscillospiraceae bacterium]
MKKTIALVLTLVLAFALAVPAFAAVPDGAILWDDFSAQDGKSNPGTNPAGNTIWWVNWANLIAEVVDGVATIDYRPEAYDPADTEALWTSEAEYYTFAGDWAGNWGQAVDIWATAGQYHKYLNINIKGAAGGEENALLLNMHPEDRNFYTVAFKDLVLADGSSPKITTDWQTLTIDLAASNLPQMTNAMHIFAYKNAVISLDEVYFTEPTGVAIDTTSVDTIIAPFPAASGTVAEYLSAAFAAGTLNAAPADSGTDAPAAPSAPKTGDSSLLIIAGAALLLSAAGVVTVLKLRKN